MIHRFSLTPLLALVAVSSACSSSSSDDAGGAAGAPAVAGAPSFGGTAGRPGAGAAGSAGTAGTPASGGTANMGGSPSSAGTPGSAGTLAMAGKAGGGAAGNGAGGSGASGGAGNAAGAAGAGAGGKASGGTGGAAGSPGAGKFVEDDGEDCEVGTIPQPSANTKLPDPFEKADGTRITAKTDWRCQRRFLRKVMEKYVYGEKPKPEMVTGTVTNDRITVNISHGGKTASFNATVSLPTTGTRPYPAIIGYPAFGSISLNETFVKNQGVAIIEMDPYTLGAEGTSRAAKSGVFYTVHGSTHNATGLLVAWAWGVSRIIDVLVADGDKILKASGIGVTGCSRFGKGSFVAGAFDQRIALGIPFESGTAGVPFFRGIGKLEQSQSLSSAYGEQPWFGDVFNPFVSGINNLPGDTHTTIGMYAPRGLLILDNPHIANLGPKAAHVAAQAGAEIYKALGAEANMAYMSNVADGGHCSWRSEFEAPLKAAIDRHLHKKDGAAGAINARSGTTGSLAEWRDWTTPTLN